MLCGAVQEDRSCGWTKSMPQGIALNRMVQVRTFSESHVRVVRRQEKGIHALSLERHETGRHHIHGRINGLVKAHEGLRWLSLETR